MNTCRTVLYSGRVQGVGFRFTAERLAASFKVVGYVKNLSDGRVELLTEGERDEVERFLSAIDARLGDLIRDAQQVESPPTNRFHQFTIAY